MDNESTPEPGVLSFEEGLRLMHLPDDQLIDLSSRLWPVGEDDIPQITKNDVRGLLAYSAHVRGEELLAVEYDHNHNLEVEIRIDGDVPTHAVVITCTEMRVFLEAAGIDLDDEDADWGDLMLVLQERVDRAARAVLDYTADEKPVAALARRYPELHPDLVRDLLRFPAATPNYDPEFFRDVVLVVVLREGGELVLDLNTARFAEPRRIVATRKELVTYLGTLGVTPEIYDTMDLGPLMPSLRARVAKVAKTILNDETSGGSDDA